MTIGISFLQKQWGWVREKAGNENGGRKGKKLKMKFLREVKIPKNAFPKAT